MIRNRKTVFTCVLALSLGVLFFGIIRTSVFKDYFFNFRTDMRQKLNKVQQLESDLPVAYTMTSHNSSGLFARGLQRVLRMQNTSLFFIKPVDYMPLMRLMGSERDRAYRVQRGRQWMSQKTVVLVATVRNAKEPLSRNMAEIHKLGKLFKDYWLIFVENDSNDGTRQYLYEEVYKNYKQTVLLGCEPINSDAPCHIDITYRTGKLHRPGWGQKRTEEERMDRGITMSVLRNMYLDYIYENLADKAELMIVIEPDLTWQPWDMDNIAQGIYYFDAKPQLDNLCANARLGETLYDPCARTYFQKKRFIAVTEYDHSYITDDIAMNKNSLPVKVESCFQAFSVYRISTLFKKRLHHYPVPSEWSCEHNTLARRLREIYIDPQMRLVIKAQFSHS